jgi:hypothetical protein
MESQRGRRTPRPSNITSSTNPWHAVAIAAGPRACPAVRELNDKRFLPADAPSVPLRDCTSPLSCQCIYRHYTDRRVGLRRAVDRGSYRVYGGHDRRQAIRGRREDD